MALQLDAGWLDWYRAQHDAACAVKTGSDFETYVTSALHHFHPGFINPEPAGTLGDGGCDGITADSKILYACYGSRQIQNAERALADKIENDFSRGFTQWAGFTTWRFVTNARTGPLATKQIGEIRGKHGDGSHRPLTCDLWQGQHLWTEVVRTLTPEQLNELLPGVPRAENVELSDLVPLIDKLGNSAQPPDIGVSIRPVPTDKLEFNQLPETSQAELKEGRLLAPVIGEWFEGHTDPELRDKCATTFREIYEKNKTTVGDPAGVLERIYTALGGSDFRHDISRPTAVYAVTSYFFDSCDIFEEPPEDWTTESANAAAD